VRGGARSKSQGARVDKHEFGVTRGYKCDISFVCPKCSHNVFGRVDVPEPHWMADRASDITAEDDIDLQCPECGDEFSAHVFNSGGDCDIALHDFPAVKVDAGQAFYDGPDSDDWDEPEPPENAFSVFLDSHRETLAMLKENSMPLSGSNLMFRMLFVHQISAMEAFLADTAINEVTSKPEAMDRLLKEDKDLMKEKFDLAQIAADPNIVRKTVIEHLRSLMYHNIGRVNALYGTVFKMNLFRMLGKDEVDILMQAIFYRHDCVHRNGYTKEGERLTVFTPEYVGKILTITHKLVDAIERARVIGGLSAAISAVGSGRSLPPRTGP
jgi:predicted RNA-binding Zn-ribbon protein involved in translation (DUF1610 family)